MQPNYNRILVAAAMLLALMRVAAGADITVAKSRIVAVTVMADRAEVTRLVTARVQAGESLVAVEGLLPGLDEHSLRAEEPKGATLQGLGSDIVKRARAAPGMPEQIVQRLKAIRARIAGIDATVLGLRRQVDLVRIYRTRTLTAISGQATVPPSRLPNGKLDLELWGKTLDELSSQELEVLNKTRILEVERFVLQNEQKELEQKWKAHTSPELVDVRRALVGISAPVSGEISFRLVYRVAGPAWRVRYNLRLDTRTSTMLLEGYGVVSQKTGEDWVDVDLVLSTRLPSCGLRAPAVPPLVLEGRKSSEMRSEVTAVWEAISAAQVEDTAATAKSMGVGAGEVKGELVAPDAPPAQTPWADESNLDQYVALHSSLAGENYRVIGKVTIRGNGLLQQVPILRSKSKVSLGLEAVPRYSNTVYRRVRLTNDLGTMLQPGRASLFLDGAMVGMSTTPAVVAGKDLVLSFGAVEGLDITAVSLPRKKDVIARKRVDEKGDSLTYDFDYHWEVHNRTNQPVSLNMLEAVPVSEVKEIRVQVDAGKSSAHTTLPNGILRFPVKVPARGKSTVNLHYTIFLPAELL